VNTNNIIGELGVECSHVAVHNWVQKADLQPDNDAVPNQIAVDETVIRLNGEQYWLYAALHEELPGEPRSSLTERLISRVPSTGSASEFRCVRAAIGTASNVSFMR